MAKQACCWWVSEFKKCVGLEISLWRLHSLYLLDCNLCLWKQTSNSSNFSQEVIMESLDWDKVPFPDKPSWFKDPSKHLITIEVLLKCDSSCNVEPSCTWMLLQLIMWFLKKQAVVSGLIISRCRGLDASWMNVENVARVNRCGGERTKGAGVLCNFVP